MRRGDIFHLAPPRRRRGHEQSDARYGVVVQADVLLVLSTVIVAPRSTRALAASFRPEVTVRGRLTRVLVDHLGAVDPARLGRSAGRLARDELRAVDDALGLVLGLAF